MSDSSLDTTRFFSTLTPTLSPAFISADDAAVYAHDLIGARREEEYVGFVLSKDNHYFVTIPQSSAGALFRPSDVLSTGENGDILPPQGYAIEGIYHSHTVFPRTASLSEDENDLLDNFFSMMDLRTAVFFRHNYPRFYLSNPDGSLLRYISTDSEWERALIPLFRVIHPGPVGHLAQPAPDNSLLPSDLLAMIHLAGDLRVICPGVFWRRRSSIGADWRTRQAIDTEVESQAPLCGPILMTANAAAKWAQVQIRKKGLVQQVGFILKHAQKSEFACTRPKVAVFEYIDRASAYARSPSGAALLPADYHVFAAYHSVDNVQVPVAASQRLLMSNCFTPDNLRMGFWLIQNGIAGSVFFSAPEGALLHYRWGEQGSDRELVASVTRRNGQVSDFEHLLSVGILSALDYVRHVAQACVLEVLEVDPVWTRKGRVTESWQPFAVLPDEPASPSA